jgi:hypothetical protein
MAVTLTTVAEFVYTPRFNGSLCATTASMTNGQSSRVQAYVATVRGNGTIIESSFSSPSLISSTTAWLNSSGATHTAHSGWIV